MLTKIRRLARSDLLDKLVGLSLSPEYHSNLLRIITLIHVVLVEARGAKLATRNELVALLNGFGDHAARANEDPGEDVFVCAVAIPEGLYRIFTGTYPASDYSLQRMLSAVLAQHFSDYERVSRECQALLTLSDAVAERCGLQINSFAESKQWREDWPFKTSTLIERGRATRFSDGDLRALQIESVDLEPFCVPDLDGLLDAPFGATALCRRPLIRETRYIHMPIPSLVSPALRLHLAHTVAAGRVPPTAIADFHAAQFARWLGVDLARRKTKPILATDLDLPEPDLDVQGVTGAVLRFDEDKLAHIVVLERGWEYPPDSNIHYSRTASPQFELSLNTYLRTVQQKLAAQFGATRGLTLVIEDSPGWSTNLKLPPDLATYWFCAGFHAHSFSFLLADWEFSLVDLWKMLCEHRTIHALGIRLSIWPDILAYWSVWVALGWTFWPKSLDLRQFGGMLTDTSKILEFMHRVRVVTAKHAAPLPSGEWLQVERWIEELSPSQDYTKPIFLEPISLVMGELRSVVERK
jgi:hypothetical protein